MPCGVLVTVGGPFLPPDGVEGIPGALSALYGVAVGAWCGSGWRLIRMGSVPAAAGGAALELVLDS